MAIEKTPVLIVGAGPTGLTMANLLARMGTPFLLIDQKPHPSRESKAFGIQARTLEIFDQLGIAQTAIQQGKIDNTVHLLVKGREVAKFRLQDIIPGESPYPYFLILPQNQTEALLINALEEKGQKVQWEHKIINYIMQDNDGIMASIQEPSGKVRQIQVQYLLGCDGADSFVREKGGFSFEGKTYSPTFYLADCGLQWKLPHGDIYFSLAPGYLSIIFSFTEKHKYRVFNFLNKRINKKEGDLSRQDFQEIMNSNPHLPKQVKEPEWISLFRIHSRNTHRFQKGRIFLAGDAAHVHSPAAGQGMNTGIQDAYNLAWKLTLVLKGLAALPLLNTYHDERHIISTNLHKTTDRFFQLMIQQNKLADFFRLHVFPRGFRYITGIKWLRQEALRRVSQIAIKYPFSSLSRETSAKGFYRKAPRAGDRAPYTKIVLQGIDMKEKEADVFQLFNCTRFTLLIAVSDPEAEKAIKLTNYLKTKMRLHVEVHILSNSPGNRHFYQVYGIQQEAVFLIRPDGHIGFKSANVDITEVKNYLKCILRGFQEPT